MTQLLPPKKEVALALLERSNVDVYLDPRARGVVVPPQFRKEPRLILKIGLNMPVPIPDLRLDDESMSCTLSFSRSPFYCVVPWSSVFAMVGEDGRGMVWPDDVPQELAVKVVDDKRPPAEAAPTRSESASSRRGARANKLAEDAPSAASAPGSSGRASGKKRKKRDDDRPDRPVLVAVPSPRSAPVAAPASAPSSSRSTEADVQREAGGGDRGVPHAPVERRPRPAPQQQRDGVSAIPSARIPPVQRRPEGPRPKRELPPYLRVVK